MFGGLQAALAAADTLIRQAAERVEANGGDPQDALRGLMITPDEMTTLLAQEPLSAAFPTSALPHLSITPDSALAALIARFDLAPLDVFIILLTLAPDLDRRYERIYGFLQDDVTMRRPTPHLMINLLGRSLVERYAVWQRLSPQAPLRDHALIRMQPDPARPNSGMIGYIMSVEPTVTAMLTGSDLIDDRVRSAVWIQPPMGETPAALVPIRAWWHDSPMIALESKDMDSRRSGAAALAAEFGTPLCVIDAGVLASLELAPETAWRAAMREARLRGAAVLIDHWSAAYQEMFGERHPQPPRDVWERVRTYPYPLFLSGLDHWEPGEVDRGRRLLRVTLPIPDFDQRRAQWDLLAAAYNAAFDPAGLDEIASKFRFTSAQTARAMHTAADYAASRGEAIRLDDIYAGAQAHSTLKLGQLARRVIPKMDWDDLILPPEPLEQLHEIASRARFAHIVHERWGFQKFANAGGVSALFAGDSGTGKTLAAEVIANELGLTMYTIELSAVVSKYIGETEKNLDRIFTEAEDASAVLFFDEADALFGKRSEVKDARDRYANIEIAYLLQRLEQYNGVAIMATNLRQNIDDAFTRRLDFLIDFPFPEQEYRYQLWLHHFPTQAPLGDDVNLQTVARQHRLAGGNIRNAAMASAFLAAEDGGVIHMAHIQGAVRREHQKMGRLIEA